MARRPQFRQATIAGAVTGYRPSVVRPSFMRRIPWPVVGGLVLFGIGVWFLFGSHRFVVRSVSVTGSVNDGVMKALDELKGRNIFLLGTGHLETSLPTQQSSIASLHIVKGFPDTLRVNVTVRSPVVRWQARDQTVFLDQRGIAFTLDPVPPSSVTDPLPLVIDPHAQPISIGTQLVTPAFVQFVVDLKRSFHDRINLDLNSLAVGETVRELDVTTANHLTLRFDTTRSLDPQLKTLAALLAAYGPSIHESVDLRVEGRVFYK